MSSNWTKEQMRREWPKGTRLYFQSRGGSAKNGTVQSEVFSIYWVNITSIRRVEPTQVVALGFPWREARKGIELRLAVPGDAEQRTLWRVNFLRQHLGLRLHENAEAFFSELLP